MNLDKAHRKIEHDKISREVRTAVENKVIPKVQSACLAATALVLHDKFGFGKQRLNKYIEEVFYIFESIYLEYTEFEDIKRCIYDELGFDFDAIEKKREDELKAVSIGGDKLTQMLTPNEVAEKLKVSRQMVSKLVKEGKLQADRVGHRYRFKEEYIEEYLKQKP